MKRLLAALLLLSLALSALPSCSESLPAGTELLTAAPWAAESGETLTFRTDGTAVLTMPDSDPIEGTYLFDGETVAFSYRLYGQRTLTAVLEEKDGAYRLAASTGDIYYSPAALDLIREQQAVLSNVYGLAWGEEIRLGFTSIRLTEARLYRKLIGSGMNGYTEPAASGIRYFALVGTIKNNSGTPMNRGAVAVSMTFDQKNTYEGKIYVDYAGSLVQDLPASAEGVLYIYAAIPESVADTFAAADVCFGFDEKFRTVPEKPEDAAYAFMLRVDETLAALSREEPPREKTYFSESPTLPVPTGYADVRQTGHSSASSNNKVTRISYTYGKEYDADPGSAVFGQYINGLKDDGYGVVKSGDDYVIYNGKTKLASVSFTDQSMTLDIVPGNDGLKGLPGTAEADAEAKTDAEKNRIYHLGDTLQASCAVLELTKSGSSSTIYSYAALKKKPSKWYYYSADSGNTLYYVLGTFTNTKNVNVNVQYIYAELTLDGKHYECTVRVMRRNGTGFFDRVEPQGSYPCVIYAEVPASVAKNAETCYLQVGFDPDYHLRYTKNGRLDFDRCEEIFTLKIK